MATRPENRIPDDAATRLWRAWAEHGDVKSRDRLVLSYAPMVKYLATRKVRELPGHIALDDLVSAGLIGLMQAADRYNPDRGATFEQFAWTRVSGAITDEIRRGDFAPRSLRRAAREMRQAELAVQQKTGQEPTPELVAAETGGTLSPEKVVQIREEISRANTTSLNKPAGNQDDPALELMDILEADGRAMDDHVLGRERMEVLQEAIARLSAREQTIVKLVFVDELPGRVVAPMLGVTESRVSQIGSEIRRKLQRELERYERGGTALAAA
jgi:RNA polymerase sigma factor for flagellar operon FliA